MGTMDIIQCESWNLIRGGMLSMELIPSWNLFRIPLPMSSPCIYLQFNLNVPAVLKLLTAHFYDLVITTKSVYCRIIFEKNCNVCFWKFWPLRRCETKLLFGLTFNFLFFYLAAPNEIVPKCNKKFWGTFFPQEIECHLQGVLTQSVKKCNDEIV